MRIPSNNSITKTDFEDYSRVEMLEAINIDLYDLHSSHFSRSLFVVETLRDSPTEDRRLFGGFYL